MDPSERNQDFEQGNQTRSNQSERASANNQTRSNQSETAEALEIIYNMPENINRPSSIKPYKPPDLKEKQPFPN